MKPTQKPARKPVVAVLFAGVGLAACAKDPVLTHNPPPPPEPPTMNPPPPEPPPEPVSTLPLWEDVASSHPEGATNPPMPVLEVKDGACYKAWYDPRAMPVEARGKGARKLPEGEEPKGTQVQCTPELLAKVIDPPAEPAE